METMLLQSLMSIVFSGEAYPTHMKNGENLSLAAGVVYTVFATHRIGHHVAPHNIAEHQSLSNITFFVKHGKPSQNLNSEPSLARQRARAADAGKVFRTQCWSLVPGMESCWPSLQVKSPLPESSPTFGAVFQQACLPAINQGVLSNCLALYCV